MTAGGESRRVDWDTFRNRCVAAKAQQKNLHILDVSEALFGTPEPSHHLSQRTWNAVNRVVDEFLISGGYCTRYLDNRLIFLFPTLSRSLGEMKCKAIANEIRRILVGSDAEKSEMAARQAPPDAEEALARARTRQALSSLGPLRSGGDLDEGDGTMPEGFDARFVPLWRASNRTLVGQVAQTVEVLPDGRSERYRRPWTAGTEPLDLPLIARGVERVQQLSHAGNSILVNIPVRWHKLDQKSYREKLLTLCGRLPPDDRRFLVLTLTDVPGDLMTARIEDRIRQLRPFCRAVSCSVAIGQRNFIQFQSRIVSAVGFDLGDDVIAERDAMAEMDRFMDAVEPLKMLTFVHGLSTTSLLVAALAAGFDYLSGEAIREGKEQLRGVRSFSVPDIFAELGE